MPAEKFSHGLRQHTTRWGRNRLTVEELDGSVTRCSYDDTGLLTAENCSGEEKSWSLAYQYDPVANLPQRKTAALEHPWQLG